MTELIKIEERDGKRAVNARDLHAYLESKQDFTNWIKGRIKKYGLVENVDFIFELWDLKLNKIIEPVNQLVNGTYKTEFILSMDAAKELSMVEGNAKGKKARRYFIEIEKKYQQVSVKPLSTIEILKLTLKGIEEQNLELQEIKSEVKQLKAKTDNSSNYISVMGYARIKDVKIGLHLAAQIGTKAKAYCKEKGYSIESVPDPRFGKVNIYPYEAVEQAFNQIKVA